MLKKKEFFAILFVFLSLKAVQSCKQLWDNSCTSNNECCTKFCDNNNGQWAAGVCKTRSGNDGDRGDDDNGDDNNNGNDNSGCKPLWDNSCTSNNECCTKFCDNNNGQWAAGVCKTRSGNDGDGDDNKPDNGSGDDDNGNGDNNGSGGDDNKNGNDNDDSGGDDNEPSSNSLITQSQFKNAVVSNGYSQPSSTIYNNFVKLAVSVGKIKTKSELGMFLAHTLHETDGFKAMREYYCYPTFNSGCAYSSGVGIAGKNYFGRGYLQLSWDYNYKAASASIFGNNKLLKNPDLVASDDNIAWSTAFWFWKTNVIGGQYGQAVKRGQFGASRNAINGGLECRGNNQDKAKKRFKMYKKILIAFNIQTRPDETGCYGRRLMQNNLINQTEFINALLINDYPQPSSTQYYNLVKQVNIGSINSKLELAMFLAHALWESDGLRQMRESMCNTTQLNNNCGYTTGLGYPDQYYFGRGYFQLSWDFNYRTASIGLYHNNTLLKDPDQVASNDEISWATALWFWKTNVVVGQYGDEIKIGKFGSSTNAMNGNLECKGNDKTYATAKKRFDIYKKVLKAFNINSIPDETGCYNL